MCNQDNDRNFVIYKPYGFLSQFVNNGPKQNSKKLLGELYDFPEGVMSIGRLDEKSEGLLLITTDGKLSNYICSSNVEKEYYAQLDGEITIDGVNKLKNGVKIGFQGKIYMTQPCEVKRLHPTPIFPVRSKKIRDERHGPTSWISITLCEGKFRQVRKMTAAIGFPTLRLVRVRIGGILLRDMEVGEVIKINQFYGI